MALSNFHRVCDFFLTTTTRILDAKARNSGGTFNSLCLKSDCNTSDDLSFCSIDLKNPNTTWTLVDCRSMPFFATVTFVVSIGGLVCPFNRITLCGSIAPAMCSKEFFCFSNRSQQLPSDREHCYLLSRKSFSVIERGYLARNHMLPVFVARIKSYCKRCTLWFLYVSE